MLGGKPNGALLAGARLEKLTLKPWAWLHRPFKAHWTGTLEPHWTHLLWTVKAHGLLLLETQRSRAGTWTHVAKSLQRAIKVSRSRPVAFEPYRGLLTHGAIKPADGLRVRRTVKTADSITASHWTMGYVWTIKTTRALERRRVVKVPRARVFIPTGWVWSRRAHVSRAVIAGGGMTSVMGGCVSRRVGVLTDRGQRASARRPFQDGLRERWVDVVWRDVQAKRSVVRVLAVGALKPRHRASVCGLPLVERRQTLALEPGAWVFQRRGAGAVPVHHGARGRPLQSAGVRQPAVAGRAVPPGSIVAALLLLGVSLALHQRRVPLSLS